jgi:hypothetical protein
VRFTDDVHERNSSFRTSEPKGTHLPAIAFHCVTRVIDARSRITICTIRKHPPERRAHHHPWLISSLAKLHPPPERFKEKQVTLEQYKVMLHSNFPKKA